MFWTNLLTISLMPTYGFHANKLELLKPATIGPYHSWFSLALMLCFPGFSLGSTNRLCCVRPGKRLIFRIIVRWVVCDLALPHQSDSPEAVIWTSATLIAWRHILAYYAGESDSREARTPIHLSERSNGWVLLQYLRALGVDGWLLTYIVAWHLLCLNIDSAILG